MSYVFSLSSVSRKNQSVIYKLFTDIWDKNKFSMHHLRNSAFQIHRQALLPYYKQGKKTTFHRLIDAWNFRINRLLLKTLFWFINPVSLYKKVKFSMILHSGVTHSTDVLETRERRTFFIWHILSHCILIAFTLGCLGMSRIPMAFETLQKIKCR